MTSLIGKTVIVTGGNTGIGLETAKSIAKLGAYVIIGCRDIEKGKKATSTIQQFCGHNKVEMIKLDLASKESINAFVSEFHKKSIPLHILINNAAVVDHTYRKNQEGIEMHFGKDKRKFYLKIEAVNHLGPFLLTNLLLNDLKETKGRIINVSAMVHKQNSGVWTFVSTEDPISWDDLNLEKSGAFSGWKAYSRTKVCNVLFTVELQKRVAETGIEVFAAHPGIVSTELVRNFPWYLKIFVPLFRLFAKSPSQGASTSIFAATSSSLSGKGGSFLADCKIENPIPAATNPDTAKRLWILSANLTGLE